MESVNHVKCIFLHVASMGKISQDFANQSEQTQGFKLVVAAAVNQSMNELLGVQCWRGQREQSRCGSMCPRLRLVVMREAERKLNYRIGELR